MTAVWLLFASGNRVKVELSLYNPPAGASRPIEAYVISDNRRDMTRAADRAAATVYEIAHQAGLAPPPTVVAYDLPGLSGEREVSGLSGGLALALALAARLWPAEEPAALAATGEIAASSGGGELRKIAGFVAKAEAALKSLPAGGCFIYPQANDPELPPSLRRQFTERKIQPLAVARVSEALELLWPEQFGVAPRADEKAASLATRKSGWNYVLPAAMILLPLIGWLAWSFFPPAGGENIPGKSVQPVEAVKPKETVISAVKPEPENKPVQKINFTGNSGLAGRLARRTAEKFDKILTEEKLIPDLRSFAGRIDLLEIHERWDSDKKLLLSTVTTAFSGRIITANGAEREILLSPFTLEGKRAMRQQLGDVVTLLVEQLRKKVKESPSDNQVPSSGRLKKEASASTVRPGKPENKHRGFE